MSDDRSLVTGVFPNRDSAEKAYNSAVARGYSNKDLNVVMSDETKKLHFTNGSVETELGTKAADGAGIGGAVGGTIGAIAAGIAAIGTSVLIPPLGIVVAGPLAAALAGAGAGAATGGLVGALVGWSMPEVRVKQYDEAIKNGGILMGVRPRSDEDAAYLENSWRDSNGLHVYR